MLPVKMLQSRKLMAIALWKLNTQLMSADKVCQNG